MQEYGIDKAGNRICKRCPFIIAAQKEYHKLCMMVNRKFGGISGVTCGMVGRYDEKHHAEYFKRIGLDIETGLPIGKNEDGILQKVIKKLEDEYEYYQNASLGWSAPSVVTRGNYAHELLEWIKSIQSGENQSGEEDSNGKE
ncbi:MAG: hypothetical protein J6Q22_09810 [Prevotella sp.]|nr:hypothetical protein [Prevotella sp.]